MARNTYCIRLVTGLLLLAGLAGGTAAQTADTLNPIREKPEKLLRNLHVQQLTQGGFNFWQDEFSGHWAGVDFGFNTLVNTDYTGYDTEFLHHDLRRSNSLFVNLVQQSIGLQRNRNTIGLVTGVGLQLQSFRLDRNTTIEQTASGRIIPKTLYFQENQKSKFSMAYLTVPLLFEFQIPVNHYENRLYLSGGMFAGLRISSHTKIKYRLDKKKEKLKTPDDFSLHKYRYGMMLRTGYRWVNLFCLYDLHPLFKKEMGPEVTPFTFGFTFVSF